jgi:hypothetical protein
VRYNWPAIYSELMETLMPTFRKLSPAEVHTLEYTGTSQRKHVEAQYDEILRAFAPGDYAQVELEPDEKRLTVRNRLTAAARRSGVTLHFLRTAPPTLRFRVGGAQEVAGVPEADGVWADPQPATLATPADVTAAAPAAKRRGRPPRAAASAVESAAPPAPLRGRGRRKRVS